MIIIGLPVKKSSLFKYDGESGKYVSYIYARVYDRLLEKTSRSSHSFRSTLILALERVEREERVHFLFTRSVYQALLSKRCEIAADEFGKEGILGEDGGVAGHQQLLAGTGHSDIELAVDGESAIFAHFIETIGGEEVELVGVAHGEAVDDDVAL